MTSLQQWTVTEPYLNTSCSLGEGPYYVEERNELRFLDINNSKLYIVSLAEGPESLREIDTGMPVGVTADIEGIDSHEIILAGAKDGVTKFNLKSRQHQYVTKYWSGPNAQDKSQRMRANDGNVDSMGRFWVGVFVDPEIEDVTDEGTVFRMNDDGGLTTIHEQVEIPNSITWSADQKTVYITDTTAKKIWAYDYQSTTGDVNNKKVFFEYDGEGNPDGHVLDSEGNMWSALFGGSKLIRISPQGQITGEVLLPTRNPTCPVFVGTELFITSAKEDEPQAYPDSAKFAGNVFRIDVGVKGGKKHKARVPH